MTIKNSKSQKMKKNLPKPITPIKVKEKEKFKCPACHKIIIEDLNNFLKEDKSKHIECCYCTYWIWKKNIK